MIRLLMSLVLMTILSVAVSAFQGTLDTSFGQNGIATFSGISSETVVNDVAVQLDGKAVVVGSTGMVQNRDILLLRYNTDGSLDTSFGNNGVVITPIGSSSTSFANTVAIQTDGKIIIGGGISGYGAVLIRYNPDGSFDSSFGYGGGMLTSGDFFKDIAITQNGEIIAVRNAYSGVSRFVVQRFDIDGMPDTSFGSNGVARAGFIDSIEVSLVLQLDGKIVVAGTEINGIDKNFRVIRLMNDGPTDTSFGNNGKVETDISGDDWASAVAVDQFGSIYVAGESGSPRKMTIVKYMNNGSIDWAFGRRGRLPTSLGGIVTTNNGTATAIDIDEMENILIAGTEDGTPTKLIVQKFDKKGNLTRWGRGGNAYANLEPSDSTGKAMALVSGSIFVVGQITPPGSFDKDIVVAKFNN